MATTDPIYKNLIQFVPEQSAESQTETVKKSPPATDGGEIRSFYESVVGSEVPNAPHTSLQTFSANPKRHPKDQKKSSRLKSKDLATCVHVRIKPEPPEESASSSTSKPSSSRNEFAEPLSAPDRSFSRQTLTRLERKHFKFLQASQLGDVSKVCEFLDQGVNLNYKDFYGWTALMCAAKDGHSEVVTCLLQHGAEPALTNKEGQTAATLARLSGHTDVADSILTFCPVSQNISPMVTDDVDDLRLFYCTTCESHFSEASRASHPTSTVHLFHMGRRPHQPAYLLPESNRGFQMLLRTGWQVDQGLGPQGQGVKYPVKTVLKRDREGLGNDAGGKHKAKVTHFDPHDKAAINRVTSKPERKVSARKSAQYAAKSRDRKQRRKEQNFRHEFSDI